MRCLDRRTLAPIAFALLVVAGGCSARTKPPATTAAPPVSPAPAAPPAAAPPVGAGTGSAARKPAPGPPPLTGAVTRTAIESFNDVWKGLRAQDYEPEASAVSTIRAHAKEVEVFAVVATWCPDTRRDLPRFFKISDQAGWSMKKVRLLAVDRTKKDPGGLTEKWNVTRVPTFIFLRKGREIGRIVERPKTTLERDIAEILVRK